MNSEIRGMKYWLNLKLYLIENLINALHLVSQLKNLHLMHKKG